MWKSSLLHLKESCYVKCFLNCQENLAGKRDQNSLLISAKEVICKDHAPTCCTISSSLFFPVVMCKTALAMGEVSCFLKSTVTLMMSSKDHCTALCMLISLCVALYHVQYITMTWLGWRTVAGCTYAECSYKDQTQFDRNFINHHVTKHAQHKLTWAKKVCSERTKLIKSIWNWPSVQWWCIFMPEDK